MPSVPDSECITAAKFVVSHISGSHIRLDHEFLGSVDARHGQTLNNVDEVHMGDKARVTMALMPDKKTLYCVMASITKTEGLSGTTLRNAQGAHKSINTLCGVPMSSALEIVNSGGLDENGTYVGIGKLVNDFKVEKKAGRIAQIVDGSTPTALSTSDTSEFEIMSHISSTTISDDDCVTPTRFIVGEVVGSRVRLDHQVFPAVVALLGETLNNVEEVNLGDHARVTMALMPVMKTLYCVQASIVWSPSLPLCRFTGSSRPHNRINPFGALPITTAFKVVKSGGLDANGNYVGIGRLCRTLKDGLKVEQADRKRSNLNRGTTANYESNKADNRPQLTRLVSVDHGQLHDAPRVTLPSPDDDSTMVVNDKKRQRTESLECQMVEVEKEKSLIGRIKSAILSSPEALQMMVNIDAELMIEIMQR